MRSFFLILVPLCAILFVSACDLSDRRQDAIYLPEGDAARGEMHFVSLGCVGCHNVAGADLPEPEEAGPVRVRLGSQASRTASYGQLVTSIVNPSHRLTGRYRRDEISAEGESLMTTYNDVMTVSQLTDLVAFLQAHYVRAERPGYSYPVYDFQSQSADPE